MLTVRPNLRVGLKLIPTPGNGVHFVSAPPALIASTHTVDYVCGKCSTVLMHEIGQVDNLIIHCTTCGSYNSTDD
jgi:DNA-directed RNA polymerase subunit RPC12/RpoP